MFLKRIEIQGFKSFAEKTVFELGQGMTAVVGPNGCGKSNVVEAVRWVLGEQRPSTLRTKAMGDVIFSGSSGCGPVSLAQVTLVLDNSLRPLPIDTDEVSLSRRLYKDGQSRYLLNMRSCMLKDIKGVLYNSGLGAPEYAIMQREMIDILLANKGNERRLLLEEAAGIMRYRASIKQALNRLRAAEDSLLRLNDIVVERTRLVKRLKSEAGKARRLRTHRERIHAMKRDLAAVRLRTLAHEAEPLYGARSQLEKEIGRYASSLSAASAKEESAKLVLQEQEEQLRQKRAALAEAKEAHVSFTSTLQLLDLRMAEDARRRTELEAHLQATVNRRDQLQSILDEAKARLRELGKQRDFAWERVGEHKEALSLAEAERGIADRQARDAGEHHRNLEQACVSLRLELEKEEIKAQHAREGLARLEQQTSARRAARDAAVVQQETLSEELESVEARLVKAQCALTDMEKQIEEREQERSELDIQRQEIISSIGVVEGRREVLRKMLDAREGYAEGPKFLMSQVEEGAATLLGEEVVPCAGFEIAVEAVLSDAVEYVVVEHREDARKLLGFLRSSGAGRAKVVELHLAARGNGSPPIRITEKHKTTVVGPLLDHLEAPTDLQELLNTLLGRTLLLRNLPSDEEATELWGSGWQQLVTVEGEVFRADGIHQGGRAKEEGLLGRKNRLVDVEGELHGLEERGSLLHNRAAELQEQREAFRQKQREAMAKLHDVSLEKKRIHTEMEAAGRRLEELKETLLSLDQQVASETTCAAEAEASCAALAQRLHAAQQELAAAFEESREAHGRLQKAQLHTGSIEEEVRECERKWERLSEQVLAAQGEVQRRADELERESESVPRMEERRVTLKDAERATSKEREKLETQRGEAAGRMSRLEDEVDTLGKEREEEAQRIRQLAESDSDLRAQVAQIESKKHDVEIELARLEVRRDELLSRAGEELHVEEQDLLESEVSLTSSELESEIEKLQNRVVLLGLVNESSEAQFQEESQALIELERELTDVREGRDELLGSIDKANRTAKSRFWETWDRVNQHFGETFAQLFPGGKAWLELTGEGSALSRDIEFVVHPPGKRTRPIELLSGGERALTALAFMFALYKEKAGPLCILDEVDAPLDDANTSRFLDMLDSFSKKTQYVVVTHNRFTMSKASRLLGVTMDKGVSKLVSVQLSEGGAQKVS